MANSSRLPLSERVPGDIIWVLKLGTIISAFMCLLIAHYLSKPIERLRNATNELARGNLDIRVGATSATAATRLPTWCATSTPWRRAAQLDPERA